MGARVIFPANSGGRAPANLIVGPPSLADTEHLWLSMSTWQNACESN